MSIEETELEDSEDYDASSDHLPCGCCACCGCDCPTICDVCGESYTWHTEDEHEHEETKETP